MEPRRDVFQAIADPTRRAIIRLIADEPANVNTIADQFDVTRQAISLHLKVLTECGLLSIRQQGRERFYKSRPEKLKVVNTWLRQYEKFWNTKLEALDEYLVKSKKSK